MSDSPQHGAHAHPAGTHPPAQAAAPPHQPIERAGITVGELFGVLRRRWVIVVVVALLGLVVGIDLLAITPKTYESTAVVDISPSLDDSGASSSSTMPNPITEAKIAVSASVATKAKDVLGYVGTVSDLTKNVTVTAPLDTELLDVTYTSDTAAGAASGANAFAQSYLDYRRATTQSDLDLRTAALKTRIAALQKDLAAVVAVSASSTQEGLLRDQIETLQNQMNNYQTSVVSPGQIAGTASAPASATSPKPSLYVGAGLLLGLLGGCVLALVRERSDDRVRTRTHLAAVLSAPVLAEAVQGRPVSDPVSDSVGDPAGRRGGPTGPGLAAFLASDGAAADAYRSIAATVTGGSAGRHVVLVCGAGGAGDDDHSSVPAEMAATFASQDLPTVLTGTREAIAPVAGLLGLAHEPTLADGLVTSSVDGLSVLPLGDELSLAVTLRSDGANLDHVETAEIIVVDGLNARLPSSRLRLAQLADTAVVVAFKGRSTEAELVLVVDQLREAQTTIVGGLLLDRPSGLRELIRQLRPVRSTRTSGLEHAEVD